MQEINENEVIKIVVERISPYVIEPFNLIPSLAPENIAREAIEAFRRLDASMEKKIEEKKKALERAKEDLEKALKERELKTRDPVGFIVKTAEETAKYRYSSIAEKARKQSRAFEDGMSSIAKKAVKSVLSQ
jgi:hypothetical protein